MRAEWLVVCCAGALLVVQRGKRLPRTHTPAARTRMPAPLDARPPATAGLRPGAAHSGPSVLEAGALLLPS